MYQVLARKYRPRNFNELVGQNHVSRALTSALERGRLHHAYLFTGTRGVGKTTIARILAKCLNCETGVTSTPCEQCNTCKAVNEGRFIDLIEIDAASRTRVEDTRELLDNVPYAPTQGRFKVYLIDEVHMLSTHSFNALLKTLEEPPAHVKFLFATTDPQKLPVTIISRCLQFTLRPLDMTEISQHLVTILDKEQIGYEADALWQLAEAAQGSVRDSLSLTDQAIAYGQGQIHHQDVKDMLGLIDRSIIYDLILAIHQNQQQKVAQLLLQFRQQALDVALVLDQLVSTLHELALIQYLPDLSLQYSQDINQKIKHLAQVISAQDLQLYYQISSKARAELSWAVTQEQGFEMCVLRLLAFKPLAVNEYVAPKINHTTAIPSDTLTTDTTDKDQIYFEVDTQGLIAVDVPSQQYMSEQFHIEPQKEIFPFSLGDDLITYEKEDLKTEQLNTVEQPLSPVVSLAHQIDLTPQQILQIPQQDMSGEWSVEKWEYWFRSSELSPAIQNIASHGTMSGEIDGVSTFHIPSEYAKILQEHQRDFEQMLLKQWPNTQFNIAYGHVDGMTASMLQEHRKQQAYDRAQTLLENEPVIRSLLDTFDAQLVDIQLK